jgi:hypothetical protein
MCKECAKNVQRMCKECEIKPFYLNTKKINIDGTSKSLNFLVVRQQKF